MRPLIDYFLSPASPWTYLGHDRFVEIARKYRADVRVAPISLATLFPASGGLPLAKRAPQRQAYRLVEMDRWSTHLGRPIVPEPAHFPVSDDKAALRILAADRVGVDPLDVAGALLAGLWRDDGNLDDDDALDRMLAKAGLPAADLAIAADARGVSETRAQLTQEAIDANVFGVPTYRFDGELFWGQDRLDFLDRALAAKAEA